MSHLKNKWSHLFLSLSKSPTQYKQKDISTAADVLTFCKGEFETKESVYKNYDELSLFLNSATVAKVLGVSLSSAYELMHEPDFPVLRVGSRMVVPKEQFIQWVMENTEGGVHK